MYNKNTFLESGSRTLQFTYHGKQRKGTVDTVYPNSVCVKLEPGTDPDKAVKFKTFKFAKIQPHSLLVL